MNWKKINTNQPIFKDTIGLYNLTWDVKVVPKTNNINNDNIHIEFEIKEPDA